MPTLSRENLRGGVSSGGGAGASISPRCHFGVNGGAGHFLRAGFGSIHASSANVAALASTGLGMAAMSPQAFSQSKSKTALTYMPGNSAWGMAMLSESIRIFPDDPLFIISSDLMQQKSSPKRAEGSRS